MIIHTERTTRTAKALFSYFFSQATGNLLPFASREEASTASINVIEITVDAELYAQDIDALLDIALPRAQAAVKDIPVAPVYTLSGHLMH